MPNTAYFKRMFSIASAILVCINIWTAEDLAGKDLTLVMFIISNLLTIFGIEFDSQSNTSKMQIFRKICSGILIIFSFVLIFDEGKSFSLFITESVINMIYTVVCIFTCMYIMFLSMHLTTHDELNKSLATSIDTTFNIINKEAEKLRSDIEQNGGWNEFLKTEIGKQFAYAIKENTKKKSPRDHKKKRRRK